MHFNRMLKYFHPYSLTPKKIHILKYTIVCVMTTFYNELGICEIKSSIKHNKFTYLIDLHVT